MAHPELELISNIVATNDFTTVKKKGVTRELFVLDSCREVFGWLWDEFHNPQQRGEVPTIERLLRKFPDFDYCPTRNSVSALVGDIRRQNCQIKLNKLIEDMGEEIVSDSDPTLVLQSFLPRLRDLNVESAEDGGISLSDAAEMIRQEYYTKQSSGGVIGIPYPWNVMNTPTGGMQDEQFIVIYGRPGNMKTWLACVIAAHAWKANRRVMFFSKEISSKDIVARITSVLAEVDYAKLTTGNLSVEDEEHYMELVEAIQDIEEEAEESSGHRRSLLCVSDKGKRRSSTVEDLIAIAERFGPDLVVVDGLYLLRDARSGQKSADWKQISHISQDLKGMAQYLECPVVGTTQANRAGAKGVSGDLDDLSFADSIGQDADIVMRCFRGPNPTGRGASIMLTFSKVREAVLRPFVINAFPGGDFSVLETSVNISQFLDAKQRMEQEESQAAEGGTKDESGSDKPKPKKRKKVFRD